MSNLTELVITSDASGQLWNSCVWDHRAGTSLMVYKGGGVSAARSLCFLGDDYLLSAESVKPLLHIWPLNSQETVQQGLRNVLPGRVCAMATSPDGSYCIAGIGEKLHVWHIGSGRLLAVVSRHFQKITCIKFTDDGSYFVSSGEDGMVMIWSLANLIQVNGGSDDPRNIFSDHSLPVQDLHVGIGGLRARLISVSNDRTCKVYDMASGSLLLSVIFNSPLTAVTADITGTSVFVGTLSGTIHCFELRDPPRMREYHVESMDEKAHTFLGHLMAVTCLSTSIDGLTLLSGSNDEKVMIWHIPSRQCVRILPHKGPITNAFFIMAPKQMFAAALKPKVLLHSFQRGMDSGDGNSNLTIRIMTKEKLHLNMPVEQELTQHVSNATYRNTSEDGKIKDERDFYKKINFDLYNFAVKELFKSTTSANGMVDNSVPYNEMAVDEDEGGSVLQRSMLSNSLSSSLENSSTPNAKKKKLKKRKQDKDKKKSKKFKSH